jgi:hypothetical protein
MISSCAFPSLYSCMHLSPPHNYQTKEQSFTKMNSVHVLPRYLFKVHFSIVTCGSDYRWGLDWWMDLLTTLTYDSELQAVTAPPLISTILKSSQHLWSLFQPAVCSAAVPWHPLLTVEILQLHALKSSLHRLLYRTELKTELNWTPDFSVITS